MLNNEITIDNAVRPLIPKFFEACIVYRNEGYAVARTKQWLSQIAKKDIEINELFSRIKVIHEPGVFRRELYKSLLFSQHNSHTHFNHAIHR